MLPVPFEEFYRIDSMPDLGKGTGNGKSGQIGLKQLISAEWGSRIGDEITGRMYILYRIM